MFLEPCKTRTFVGKKKVKKEKEKKKEKGEKAKKQLVVEKKIIFTFVWHLWGSFDVC